MLSLRNKKTLCCITNCSQEGAIKDINEYLSTFTFPSEESKKLTKVALIKLLWSSNFNAI